MRRLRSNQAREQEDARYTLNFLRLQLRAAFQPAWRSAAPEYCWNPRASRPRISRGDTGGGLVATQWVLHGTHTGPLMDGTPPTGRTVAYSGASFTQVEGDKIRSEHTSLDRQTVAEQLGLKGKQT
jgi:hypothetical protein